MPFKHQHVWTDVVSPPDLCGALPGCGSPHHLPEPEAGERDQNQKHHHLLCLAAVRCNSRGPVYGRQHFPDHFHFFDHSLHFYHRLFLQPFSSLCSDSSRARGRGRGQKAG